MSFIIDRDTINGVIVIICFAAIYYHWIVYELKEHLLEELPQMEKRIAEAAEMISETKNWRRPKALLNESRWLLKQASQGKEKSKLGEILDARQSLHASQLRVQRAVRLAARDALP